MSATYVEHFVITFRQIDRGLSSSNKFMLILSDPMSIDVNTQSDRGQGTF